MQMDVDGVNFVFPDEWMVAKYDDWEYYRNKFTNVNGGAKALDLLAIDQEGTVWFIEVKNYINSVRTKPIDIADEIEKKVFDTLAGLLPAKINSNIQNEKDFADLVFNCHNMRIVLHLEQPEKHSRLRPRAINPSDLQIKLRQKLKPLNARPMVVERGRMQNLGWNVGLIPVTLHLIRT